MELMQIGETWYNSDKIVSITIEDKEKVTVTFLDGQRVFMIDNSDYEALDFYLTSITVGSLKVAKIIG